jgi:ubiquinone/menaquinone biosynthesis C-methylase UbiE
MTPSPRTCPARGLSTRFARGVWRRGAVPGLALMLLLLAGCTATQPATPPPASATPDINAPYRDPELDVGQWVKLLEGESREIAKSRDAIVAALGVRPGMTVADVGAGTGLFLQPLAESVGPRGRLYAVDIAPAFLEHLRQRAEGLRLPQVEVRACTDRSVELPRDSLDLAFVCDTYHHFEHPQETLASLRAALRPGGRLVIVDFERQPGASRDWVLQHVRLGKADMRREVEAAGFHFLDEARVQGLHENYLMRFARP